MTNPFGIEHPVSKRDRDYSRARDKWDRKARHANRIENAGQTVAGASGAALGAAALRDQAFKDHPEWGRRMVQRATVLPPQVGETLVRRKPGLAGMAALTGGSAVAYAGTKRKRQAEKKRDKYAAMSKGLTPNHNSEASMRRHRTAQGVLGTTAATTGLMALGAKTAPKLLPTAMKATGKGAAYQKHLDRAASGLLFAGAGIGGASGIHQSRIYSAEGKQRVKKGELTQVVREKAKVKERSKKAARTGVKLAAVEVVGPSPRTIVAHQIDRKLSKAYDPDKHRIKRQKATEVGLAATAAGAGVAAGRGITDRRKTRTENLRVAETRKEGVAQLSRGVRRLKQADAERSYLKANNYDRKRDKGLQTARTNASQMHGLREASSGYEKIKASPKPIPKHRVGALALGAAAAGGAAVTHRNRKREEKRQATPTRGWYSG